MRDGGGGGGGGGAGGGGGGNGWAGREEVSFIRILCLKKKLYRKRKNSLNHPVHVSRERWVGG